MVRPEDLLSPQEIDSIRYLQNAYAVRARIAAANLADTLELDEEVRNQLIGSIGIKLATLDFEQRKDLADSLRHVAELVGSTALSAADEHTPILLVETQTVASEEDTTTEIGGGLEQLEKPSLTQQQRTWFAKVFGVENIDKIELLNVAERKQLGDSLARIYLNLKIARATAETKERWVKSLGMIIDGSNFKAISEQVGQTYNTVFAGVQKMAESITSRVSREELLGLIPVASIQDADHGNPENEPTNPLSAEQKKWYKQLLQEAEIVESLDDLTALQRIHLARRLGQRLDPLLRVKEGAEITEARVRRMLDFLMDRPLQEIAAERHMTVEGAWDELSKSANRLRARTPAEDLVGIVDETFRYQPAEE